MNSSVFSQIGENLVTKEGTSHPNENTNFQDTQTTTFNRLITKNSQEATTTELKNVETVSMDNMQHKAKGLNVQSFLDYLGIGKSSQGAAKGVSEELTHTESTITGVDIKTTTTVSVSFKNTRENIEQNKTLENMESKVSAKYFTEIPSSTVVQSQDKGNSRDDIPDYVNMEPYHDEDMVPKQERDNIEESFEKERNQGESDKVLNNRIRKDNILNKDSGKKEFLQNGPESSKNIESPYAAPLINEKTTSTTRLPNLQGKAYSQVKVKTSHSNDTKEPQAYTFNEDDVANDTQPESPGTQTKVHIDTEIVSTPTAFVPVTTFEPLEITTKAKGNITILAPGSSKGSVPPLQQNSQGAAIAIPAVVGLLVLGILAFIIYRKKFRKRQASTKANYKAAPLDNEQSVALTIDNLEPVYAKVDKSRKTSRKSEHTEHEIEPLSAEDTPPPPVPPPPPLDTGEEVFQSNEENQILDVVNDENDIFELAEFEGKRVSFIGGIRGSTIEAEQAARHSRDCEQLLSQSPSTPVLPPKQEGKIYEAVTIQPEYANSPYVSQSPKEEIEDARSFPPSLPEPMGEDDETHTTEQENHSQNEDEIYLSPVEMREGEQASAAEGSERPNSYHLYDPVYNSIHSNRHSFPLKPFVDNQGYFVGRQRHRSEPDPSANVYEEIQGNEPPQPIYEPVDEDEVEKKQSNPNNLEHEEGEENIYQPVEDSHIQGKDASTLPTPATANVPMLKPRTTSRNKPSTNKNSSSSDFPIYASKLPTPIDSNGIDNTTSYKMGPPYVNVPEDPGDSKPKIYDPVANCADHHNETGLCDAKIKDSQNDVHVQGSESDNLPEYAVLEEEELTKDGTTPEEETYEPFDFK